VSHRAAGSGLRLALRPRAPRHAPPRRSHRRAVRAFTAIFVVLGLVDAVLLTLVLRTPAATVPPIALPRPTISIPAPAVSVPRRELAPGSAVRQLAKARPVLLGPIDLAAYCPRIRGGASLAVLLDGEWACSRPLRTPALVDMNAACRTLYTADAWAGMLDDTDPQSWRCYTGES